MEISLVIKLVTDYLLQKANDAGIPISKTQLYAGISVIAIIVTYFIGSFIFQTPVEKEIAAEKIKIEQTEVLIKDVKATLENTKPPNQTEIETKIKKQIAEGQDSDASVF